MKVKNSMDAEREDHYNKNLLECRFLLIFSRWYTYDLTVISYIRNLSRYFHWDIHVLGFYFLPSGFWTVLVLQGSFASCQYLNTEEQLEQEMSTKPDWSSTYIYSQMCHFPRCECCVITIPFLISHRVTQRDLHVQIIQPDRKQKWWTVRDKTWIIDGQWEWWAFSITYWCPIATLKAWILYTVHK